MLLINAPNRAGLQSLLGRTSIAIICYRKRHRPSLCIAFPAPRDIHPALCTMAEPTRRSNGVNFAADTQSYETSSSCSLLVLCRMNRVHFLMTVAHVRSQREKRRCSPNSVSFNSFNIVSSFIAKASEQQRGNRIFSNLKMMLCMHAI